MRSHSLLAILAFVQAAAALQVIGPAANLPIVNKVISPDGVPRSAVLAGGTFPGPLIVGTPSSTFQINVQDQLTDKSMNLATSIHWHGLFQKNTTYDDGVAFVSQCPITPGNSFTYAFNAAGQSGTYWYHSHYSNQYCDGLRGPLVIYDPNDPYKSYYDVDDATTVITLADWYHKSSLIHSDFDYPDSTLINGLGRAWANTKSTPLSVTTVNHGTRYRLRLVSVSCELAFTFSIDGHNLTVIEADGILHRPYSVDSVTVYDGQRYSAILTANQPIGNYWIRALPVADGLSFPNGTFAGGINSAILRYNGALVADPKSTSTAGKNELVEANMVPLVNPAAPGTPDLNAPDVYKLNFDFTLNPNDLEFYLNGVERGLPTVPILLQIMSGAQTAQSLVPQSQLFPLQKNSVIQISFPGSGPAPTTHHPIHLHGHPFSVIRSAGQSGYNFVNPPRRDVVSMGNPTDNVTIRFVTDNAGPWFLHCHIEWHLNASFAAVFIEDTPVGIKDAIKPPSAWNNLCSAWNAFGGKGGL